MKTWWRNPNGVSCCFDCEKRQLGCRTSCEAWAEHEKRKKAKYASKEQRRSEIPEMRRMELNEKFRTKEWKTKGKSR